jgi:hypothetical protein
MAIRAAGKVTGLAPRRAIGRFTGLLLSRRPCTGLPRRLDGALTGLSTLPLETLRGLSLLRGLPFRELETVDFIKPLLVVNVTVATVFLGGGKRGGKGCVSTRNVRPPKIAFIFNVCGGKVPFVPSNVRDDAKTCLAIEEDGCRQNGHI